MDNDTRIVISAFRRFLIKEKLWDKFKADYKFIYKRRILEEQTQKQYNNDLDWLTYFQIRVKLNRKKAFQSIIDISLYYNGCFYNNWSFENQKWHAFYKTKIEKLLQQAQ